MRAFLTKQFDSWAKRDGLAERVLAQAVHEITNGLLGDSLGGYVYKKRINLPGRGKSGGARTLIAYRANEKVFLLLALRKMNARI